MDRVAELIAKLKDPDWSVRYTAATLLGQIGTPSVPALIAALHDRSVHGEAAKALGRTLVEFVGYEMGEHDSYIVANGDMLRGVAKALGEIASRDPTPALRDALPILRRLRIRDYLTGSEIQKAIDQIEVATASMKDLPLPSAAPQPDDTSLPRPTTAPAPSPDDLPLPAAPMGIDHSDSLETDAPPKSRQRRNLGWLKREARR